MGLADADEVVVERTQVLYDLGQRALVAGEVELSLERLELRRMPHGLAGTERALLRAAALARDQLGHAGDRMLLQQVRQMRLDPPGPANTRSA